MSKNPWKRLKKTQQYDNAWITVAEDQVTTPAGKPGIYGTVHFKNRAVGVVALDSQNNIYLVGQYRYPLDQYHWEIPMGGCPDSEEPLSCARRELKEETGLEAIEWQSLGHFHLSNCITDEIGFLFLCRDLSQGQADPDDTEQLAVKKIPFQEALDQAMNGEITDALSVIALQKVRLLGLA